MTSSTAPGAAANATQPESRLWRWLVLGSVLGNLLCNYVAQRYPFNGQTNAVVSGKYYTLLTPAGYAFSIWGLIFLGILVYAIWQLLPAQRRNPLPDAVAEPFILANVATAAWLVAFAYEQLALSVLIMFVILASLAVAYGRARRLIRSGQAGWASSVPLGLYFGWITVATVLNVSLWLSTVWQPSASTATTVAMLLLNVVLVLGVVVTHQFRELAYPLTLAWGLVGIGLARSGNAPGLAGVAISAALTLVVAAAWLVWQKRR
ncbi:tryptophan-rich sensory protein [Hymenobacter sp. BT18]|uniref:tryptophan-rich sensory protein n=1 Tax=Hymenobacter sp. BT18 TaxID=2835648 RepID=UPI00143EA003|nr:tryptophan-rich sensory protein [Hymenobacter sp. BT18]QIX62084.1 tryptophan-rich sensory protein [Hymenobacter sp. BT18]